MGIYIVRTYTIDVLGYIWQPGCSVCHMEYNLNSYDLENISETGEYTREEVEKWLLSHSGDFQSIVDFKCSFGDEFESDWENPESGDIYCDIYSESLNY
ncbi:hypothetical protein [Scytonema sp. NUACC26]|uniref:hypothetical protein n=1 Tax=Scytonema sp. NUACC26 TaxID=3140176 RepID=UPI0034DBE6BA